MRIDDDFMKEVGLAEMPEAEKQEFMRHAQEELEVRVGQEIGAGFSEEQMDAFDEINDLSEAAAWLDANAPEFREIARRVYEGFKQELIAERNNILGIA